MTNVRLTLLGAVALALGAAACKKSTDALVLLDVRGSGDFATPVVSVRFSVPGQTDAGWPTHLVSSDLGSDGLQFGYYLPGGNTTVTVQADALDAASCLLGTGALTLTVPFPGGRSPVMTLFVRPLAPSACVDAGTMGPTDAGSDAGADASPDGPGPDAKDGGDAGGAGDAGDAGDAAMLDGQPSEGGADGSNVDGGATDGPSDGASEAITSPDAAGDAADAPADVPAGDAPVTG